MRLLWWILLLAEAVLLVWAVVVRRHFRRRHAPLPAYLAGNLWSGLGMLLLIGSYLVGLDSRLGIAMLAGSFVCIALSIRQSMVARRKPSAPAI